jgi:hypothetical protein
MNEKIKVEVTRQQIDALNDIRGLNQGAHFMVMTAKLKPDGGAVLSGDEQTFQDLVLDLYDEIEFEMQPISKLKHLQNLIYQLSPED